MKDETQNIRQKKKVTDIKTVRKEKVGQGKSSMIHQEQSMMTYLVSFCLLKAL